MEVQVWSDFACPWCALGWARFEVARRAFEHGNEVTVVHRAFELDPAAATELGRRTGLSMEEAVARKYGVPVAQVRALHDRLTAMGAEVGFSFDFDRAQPGPTFDAHRLARAACGTAAEGALVQGLFRARFSEGLQLSDHDVLRQVARDAGVSGQVADEVLGSDAYADEVRADEAAAAELDITGVPHFLIGGKWPVPGAQDIDTLTAVLARAWSRLVH
ncbi:MAG TPA: DsbA family oxidoreductase [Acidimicrobiales bacterium]|nr:DsbA family oxidoreductase [Acidimicrobiales bacterium]